MTDFRWQRAINLIHAIQSAEVAEINKRDTLERLRAAHNDPNHPLGVLHRVVARGEPITGVEE